MKYPDFDKWDYFLIDMCKGHGDPSQTDIQNLRDVWKDRCRIVEWQDHYDRFIIEHLANIVDELNLTTCKRLYSLLNPAPIPTLNLPEKSYDERWLDALISIICLTKVNDIPGYYEYRQVITRSPSIYDFGKIFGEQSDRAKRIHAWYR